MFSYIRRHASFVNIVAVIALIFAMTGGALAAKKYLITSTSQIKPSVLKSLQGTRGPPGSAGAAGAQGPAGPAGAGSQGPAGPAGPPGAKGENGAAGAKGATGKAGAEGEPGPKGSTGPAGATGAAGTTGTTGPEGVCSKANCTLPSGVTETGVWSVIQHNLPTSQQEPFLAISFPIQLAEASKGPTTHDFFFNAEETEQIEEGTLISPSGCKGTLAEPQAPKGTLCVFTESEENHLAKVSIFTMPGHIPSPQYAKTGAYLFFETTGEPAQISEWGVWAVTAP